MVHSTADGALAIMWLIPDRRIAALQAEWKSFGAEAFTIEILEEVKQTDAPYFNVEDELTLLEDIWLEKLGPYCDRGYNTQGKKFRQV